MLISISPKSATQKETQKLYVKFNWPQPSKFNSVRTAAHWPSATKISLEAIGIGLSNEMNSYVVSVFMERTINVHQNSLCGCNFEYFSSGLLFTVKLSVFWLDYVN